MIPASTCIMVVATLLIAACAPTAPAPTAAPAKPTEAPKPAAPTLAASPVAAPAQPAASPAAAKPAASPPAAAAPVTKIESSGYRDGDTVNFIVATSAGGGYDTQARLLQPFLDKVFPQVTGANVKVVVQNMPGAQQRVAIEHVARSAPDGKTIAYMSGKIGMGHQVLGGAGFDLTRMTAVASPGGSNLSIAINKSVQLPEPTFLGLAKRSEQKGVLIGHTGIEPDLKLLRALLRDKGVTLNLDMVPIDGTSPLMAALLRGDIEAAITTTAGMVRFVQDNPDKLELLVNMGCQREPAAPQLSTVVEQRIPDAETICDIVGTGDRIVMGPAGIPTPTAQAVVEAFRVAINDPEHVAASQKIDFIIEHRGPEAIQTSLKSTMEIYTKYKAELQ